MPENEEVIDIYMMTRGQIITRGMDGVIVDISIPAIKDAMETRGIQDQWGCMARVRHCFHHFLDKKG